MIRLTPYLPPEQARRRRRADRAVTALLVVALVTAVAWLLAPEARASEVYTLTPNGIHLAEPLVDGDHLNVRRSDGVTVNIHIEAKCADRDDAECAGKPGRDARWLGATLIPWSALGVDGEVCAVWVQHARTGYHYGEQGEPPYCPGVPAPDPTPTPTPTPDPEPSPTPTPEPDPTPDPTPTPTPTPTEPPLECPDGKAPGWLDEDGEPTSCVDDDPRPTPTEPPAECDTPAECDEGDHWPEPTPEPIPTPDEPSPDTDDVTGDDHPDTDEPRDEPVDELAETGLDAGALGVIAAVLIAVGGLFYTIHRRNQ